MKLADCPHVDLAGEKAARAAACEECGRTFNLRACTTCGHVGCCESAAGHNTAHSRASGHPVIREVTRGYAGFLWCYACDAYIR